MKQFERHFAIEIMKDPKAGSFLNLGQVKEVNE
jgi:hypothetical protein